MGTGMEGEYIYVTPKYMKKFTLHPPCPRPPLAPGQEVDPTSLKCGEDYPDEWARWKAKLAKIAKEAVKKFNEDSATATATEASVQPRKSMPKKPARKQVLHNQCPHSQVPQQRPHGKFLSLLLLLQSPQFLRQSLHLFRPNPRHLCISPRAKGLKASLLP